MIVQSKSLPPGTSVVVRFNSGLSPLYAEPLGCLFLSDGTQVTSGKRELFEAYGYDPNRPGDTPTPFWGDHYIKRQVRNERPTLWRTIKERVNREVFLPSVRSRPVDAVLVETRIQGLRKFLCREYHRHLVDAYETVWALTEAMRRHYKGIPASRWRLAAADWTQIVGLASSECDSVRNKEVYRRFAFSKLIHSLELYGLSPHYQPMKDRLQSVSSEMFEVITSEYVRARSGFSVRRSFWIPHLSAEVDMYAINELDQRKVIVIGSDKLRVTSTRPVMMSEVEGLSRRIEATREYECEHASGIGKSLAVSGAFFTNAEELPTAVNDYAAKCRIEVFQVRLPGQWLERPVRKHLHENDVKFMGGDRHGPLRLSLSR